MANDDSRLYAYTLKIVTVVCLAALMFHSVQAGKMHYSLWHPGLLRGRSWS